MADIKVAVINDCTVLSDAEVSAAVPALQIQVHDHFARAWGIDADLRFVPAGQDPRQEECWLTILDDPDRGEDLGYHELTNDGRPICKVFARSDQARGFRWTVTASHELLELLADPNCHLGVLAQPNAYDSFLYAYEVCDPCESEAYAYPIAQPGGDVIVSDFVYPAWFEGFRKAGSTKFDHQGKIDEAFKLLPGGYAGVLDIPSGLGWYQIDGPDPQGAETRRLRPSVGSRRERRMTPRGKWRRSGPRMPSTGE